jgi:subtilisin family serine protease
MNKKFLLLMLWIYLIGFLVACISDSSFSLNVPSSLEMRQAQSLQIIANTSITWSITPAQIGILTTQGTRATYFSPNQILQPVTVTISAHNASSSVSVSIFLQPERNTKSEVQISPPELLSVPINSKIKLNTTLNSEVHWSVLEGNSRGTFLFNGEFNAPTQIPNPAVATIRATSKTNPNDYDQIQLGIVGETGITGVITLNQKLIQPPPVYLQNQTEARVTRTTKPDWTAKRTQGEVLIVQSDFTLQTKLRVRALDFKVENEFTRVKVPRGQTDAAFAKQLKLETGAEVQPNYLYRLASVPNDPLFVEQSNFMQIDAAGAWFSQVSVPDNLIAILDTGINPEHPDLQNRINLGKDFCPRFTTICEGENTDPKELSPSQGGGHGTFATGIIAARTNNNLGISGITQSGKVLVVKVFGADNFGAIADTISLSKGIRYATDQGARVISMSLGLCSSQTNVFDTPDKLTENAIAYAINKGVVLIAASGNNGANPNGQCGSETNVQFPASHPNVIAVGSVGNTNTRSSFSATGTALDLVAPGENLISLKFDTNNYELKSGTSFAAPQVAAVAGLIFAKTPTLTRVEVQNILESTAKDLGASGKDSEFGAGLLQAGAALVKATNPTAPTTVYIYADRLRTTPDATGGCPTVDVTNKNCYERTNAQSGLAIVTISGTSGAAAYSLTHSRNGKALQAGTYKLIACVNKNSNAKSCDIGDLGKESSSNLQFNGTTLTNINLTLAFIL